MDTVYSSLHVGLKLLGTKKNVLLTESLSDAAETNHSVPYIARPSHLQEAHSGETLGKSLS